MRWKPYPEYKPSGVEWLGDVPEHWERWKVTHAFQRLGSGTTPKSDDFRYYEGDIPWVTTSELRETVIEDTANKLTVEALNDYSALRIYPPGTLLFAMYGATIGRLGILGIPATVNQACAAFVGPKALAPKFAYYWLWMRRPILIVLSAGGGQPNLNQDELRQIRICAPPLDEQQAITAFLDRETGRIDGLIAKKQRQIELLAEKRSALISHAVTKGLDPNAKMKHSGIEWLGQIPEHWEVKAFGHIVSYISYGFTNPMPVEDEGPFMLTANDIGDGKIHYETARRTALDAFEKQLTNKSRPRSQDILLTKDGTLGRVAVFDGRKACINQSVALIRIQSQSAPVAFIEQVLRSAPYQEMMRFDAGGTTIKHIYITRVVKMPIAFPPMKEMRDVSTYAHSVQTRKNALTGKVEASIAMLREYRTSVISAAVTGKIDVRKEVAS